MMHCSCCGWRFKELTRVEVGTPAQEWFVCADCYTNVVPRIPRDTSVPHLSVLLGTGKKNQ
jgi:hypothetical protein